MAAEEFYWLDGRIVEAAEARVSIRDRGLLYGEGVFDTMRVYNGRPFHLHEHLKRFFEAGAVVGCNPPYPQSEIERAILTLLEVTGLSEAYLRLTMTRGAGGVGMQPSADCAPTVFVMVRPLLASPARYYTAGVRAIISDIRRNETSPLSRIKSLNYLDSLLVRRQAKEAGVDEGLMLNTRDYLAEAAASNLFIVKDEVLITPDLDSGILPGITRSVVLRLARESGLAWEERPVRPDELAEADEAFLTNSLIEVAPLVEVEGRPVGNGRPGEITLRLHSLYRALALSENRATV